MFGLDASFSLRQVVPRACLTMRPTSAPDSLEQLAVRTAQGEDFSFLLGDFLDGFSRRPSQEALTPEPAPLTGQHPEGTVLDAFLAAVAHALANAQGWPAPEWAFQAARYLHRPFFPVRAAAFRATLLLESPPPFRARNLFVTANALSRA